MVGGLRWGDSLLGDVCQQNPIAKSAVLHFVYIITIAELRRAGTVARLTVIKSWKHSKGCGIRVTM